MYEVSVWVSSNELGNSSSYYCNLKALVEVSLTSFSPLLCL